MPRLISHCLALLAAIAVSVAASAAANLAPQSSSQAGVTVKVTPRNLNAATWEFEVVFDTHSQDLNDDLLKNAVLVVDGGAALAPTGWQGDSPGGHHRKGVLRFKAPAASAPASLEMRLTRAGESAPRIFRWSMR